MQENEIVKKCQEGDVQAFRALFDRYAVPLLNTGVRMLHNKHDAEDAVQITFVKLYKNIKRFRYESKFSTYLFRIHIRVCLDMVKKNKRARMQILEENSIKTEPDYELKMQIDDAIEKLPPQQKACFILYAVEGFKQQEIAEVMNLSTGSVKSNIFHARVKLRKKILADDNGSVK
ncbi:RNA polymerase sigma factor [bacterium]|nr:RNA polymerase sigma factor [bacterium]